MPTTAIGDNSKGVNSMRHRRRRGGRSGNRSNGYRQRHREYQRKRHSGWGIGLYRNTREAKVAGVCAGIADHWEVEHWVIRLLAVVLFLFTGSLAFWGYLIAWMMLSPRRRDGDYERWEEPEEDAEEVEMEYNERHHDYRPRKMFRYGESPSVRLQRARERLDAALRRVEGMETYVTSRQYNLNEEFSKL
jgi:phage shock protein C